MPTVYLVRHGRAAASFTDDLDPGLDELGREQAVEACEALARCAPLALRTSPLKRARETGAPLEDILGVSAEVEERLAEIPSPGMSLEERGPWLRGVMQGRWSEQAPALQEWYAALVDCLKSIERDTVIFSHFVAINAAVGAAEGDDSVILFRPDNGSITKLRVENGELSVLARGREADTKVN